MKKSIISDSLIGKENRQIVLQELDLHVLEQVTQIGDQDLLFVFSFTSISCAAPTVPIVLKKLSLLNMAPVLWALPVLH